MKLAGEGSLLGQLTKMVVEGGIRTWSFPVPG